MALSGPQQLFPTDILTVDSSELTELGTRGFDNSGGEHIYLQGTTSTVAKDWVVYDENFSATRLVANEVGPIAIAPTAILVGEYGWFQIYGIVQGNSDDIAADSSLYVDGTAGRVDDLSVSGDLIIGAYSMTASVSNVATCHITYPHVSDDLGGAVGGIPTIVSSTDNAVARWDGTGGDTLQDSGVLVDDSDNITATATLTLANKGLHIFDTDTSHDLIIAVGSDLAADRVFTITTGDGDRELNLAGSTTISAFGATLTDDANAAGGRATLGLGSIATQDSTAIAITGGSITDITDLAIADGGTGAGNATNARSNLGLVIGSDVQAFGAVLDDLNTLGTATSDGQFIVATGVGAFAYESTTTARTSLGVGTSDSPTMTGLLLSGLTASEIVITDASKNLASAAVVTYPSLTELTYVKGVTSAIQTQIDNVSGGITWSAVTSDATMVVNTGSLANKGTLLTLTIPATSSVGATIRVAGMNAGLWKIAQGASQYIKFGNQATTIGATGSLASVLTYDAVELVCIEANLGWVVASSIGNITVT